MATNRLWQCSQLIAVEGLVIVRPHWVCEQNVSFFPTTMIATSLRSGALHLNGEASLEANEETSTKGKNVSVSSTSITMHRPRRSGRPVPTYSAYPPSFGHQ